MPVINLTLTKKERTPNGVAEQITKPQAEINEGQAAFTEINEGNLATQSTNTGELIKTTDSQDEVKTIRIEGPLSQIYSQALLIYYAKESAADGSMGELTENDDANSEGVNPDLYVFTTSDEELPSDEGIAQFNTLRLALDKYQGSDRIVAIEMHSGKNPYAVVLEEYAHDRKERIYHKRSIAIEAIMASLK